MTQLTILKQNAEETLRILRRKDVQELVRKHPDANWNVHNSSAYKNIPTLVGEIHLGYIDEDIRDLCTLADSDSWCLRHELINKTVRGLKIELVITAWHSYTEDEKDTLRGIGKMQTFHNKPSTYEALVCN